MRKSSQPCVHPVYLEDEDAFELTIKVVQDKFPSPEGHASFFMKSMCRHETGLDFSMIHVQRWRSEVATELKHCVEILAVQTSRLLYTPTLITSTLTN